MSAETVQQLLKQAVQAVCNFLKKVGKGTKDIAVALHKDYSNAQQIKLNQIQQNNSIAIANQIQWELFCVFRGKKYPYLQIVQVVEDIVPLRPQPPQFGILLENPSQPLPSFALPQVKDKMNYDIRIFWQWILANYTLEEAWRLFPNIMSGLYIADITRNGIYAVLTVAFPQR